MATNQNTKIFISRICCSIVGSPRYLRIGRSGTRGGGPEPRPGWVPADASAAIVNRGGASVVDRQ